MRAREQKFIRARAPLADNDGQTPTLALLVRRATAMPVKPCRVPNNVLWMLLLSTLGVAPSAGVPAPSVDVADPRTQVRVFQADNFRLNGMDFVMIAPNGTEISSWQNIDFNRMTKWLFDMPASSQITMVAETRKYPGGIMVNASTNFPLLPGGPVYVCAVPAPDLMSPCELTLERFCGENRTARQCNACADQHQRELGAAGCLPDEISDFCRVGPTEFDLVTISSSFTPVAHPTEEANIAFANLAPSFPVIEISIGGEPVAANLHFREGQPYVPKSLFASINLAVIQYKDLLAGAGTKRSKLAKPSGAQCKWSRQGDRQRLVPRPSRWRE